MHGVSHLNQEPKRLSLVARNQRFSTQQPSRKSHGPKHGQDDPCAEIRRGAQPAEFVAFRNAGPKAFEMSKIDPGIEELP
jgi:hypothetical protein